MCWCQVRTRRSCTNTQTQTLTCLTQTVASTQTVCLNTRVSSFAGLRGAAAQLHTSSANTCTWTQTRHGNINTYFFLSASERYTALFMFVFTNPPSPTSAQVYLGLRLYIKPEYIRYVFLSQEDLTPVPDVSLGVQCIRVDSRVSADHSQSCTTYSQNNQLTYGFLFPPGTPSSSRGNITTF